MASSKGKGRANPSALDGGNVYRDGGVSVTITPSSSAFFAGEVATFNIVFTNTRPAKTSHHPYLLHRGTPSSARSHHAHSQSYSAPALKNAFPPNELRSSPFPSPSASFIDLNNATAGSSHIVLPERRGVIGTPLGLVSSSSSGHATSPIKPTPRRPVSGPSHLSPIRALSQNTSEGQESKYNSGHALYSSKRLPTTAKHKKNDYSVAINPYADDSPTMDDSGDLEEGVSDLSSQLAGLALLQQRGSVSVDEEPDVDARPYVEQYRRQGEAAMNGQGRKHSSSSRRLPSNFSTISEETSSPEVSPVKRFSPTRSFSTNSLANDHASTARIPSTGSYLEPSDPGYTPRASLDFYSTGQNHSVDSMLRDSVTSWAAANGRRPSLHGRSNTRTHLPTLRPPHEHSRSYSTASPAPHSAPLRSISPDSRSSSPINPPLTNEESGTEALLWAFAQFSGSFTVEEALVRNREYIAVKQSLFGSKKGGYAATGARPGALLAGEGFVGGGSLDTETLNASGSSKGGGWTSWLWGSSPAAVDSHAASARRASGTASGLPIDPVIDAQARRRSSAAVVPQVASTASSVGSLEERRTRMMNDSSVPVFSSPPSILAVDLVLEPGESKTYALSLQLPGDLPPSFRGKAISFTYNFMVGTNRATDRVSGEYRQQSRLVRVPVRVYNHVSVTGVRPFYDLTNPIVWYRDEAKISSPDDDPTVLAATASRRRQRSGSIEAAHAAVRKAEQKSDFARYATRLLEASFASPTLSPLDLAQGDDLYAPAAGFLPSADASFVTQEPPRDIGKPPRPAAGDDGGPAHRPELMARSSSQSTLIMRSGTVAMSGEGQEETSCKSAVEIVSRNAQKVSYDINKGDQYRIATLTLVKSAYRLGDTVNVMITLNAWEARTFRIAARLETHELIETTVSIKSAAQVRQLTRRLHAEHHETTLDAGRVSFALAIPSGATPDFATSGVKLQWTLRVSFLILPPQYSSNPHVVSTAARSSHLTPPLSPNGNLHKARLHRASKSFAFSSPGTPVPVETGSHHLLPIPAVSPEQQYTCYRAVPDLSFVPTLFQSPEAQDMARRQQQSNMTPRLGGPDEGLGVPGNTSKSAASSEAVVLMPTKIETVEINIPLRVYPSATPFRSPVSSFVV